MKTTQIVVNVYEPGDIIDISECKKHFSNKSEIDGASRALVIAVNELKNGLFTYVVVTNEGKRSRITPSDMKDEKFLGHVDLSLLFAED